MAARLLVLIVLCVFGAASAAWAQGDPAPPTPLLPTPSITPTATITPTPLATVVVTAEGIVFTADAEVIFPAGVRFTIIVLRNVVDIAALTLTVERDDQPPITFDVDPDEALIEEIPNTRFAYFWDLDEASAPTLFSEIRYRWTVRSIYDEVNTANGVFQFTDARLLWQQRGDTGRRFDITIPRGINLTTLGRTMDAVYDLLATNTGERPSLSALVYDSAMNPYGCTPNEDGDTVATGPFSGEEVVCTDPTLAERIFAEGGYTVVSARLDDFADVQDALTAQLVEAFYAPLWQPRPREWVISGLKDLFSPSSEGDLLPTLTTAARNNTLLSLADMDAGSGDGRSLWRAQATGILLYIADTFGVEAVFRLARELPNIASFGATYSAITDRPATTLLPALRDWVLTERASAAFGASLYGAQTATPQPSATFTPFPATRTPRPTPTNTLPPTITMTPTPRPTATLTPTVTPRPAGSLNTATPIPTQTSQPLIDTGSRTSVLAVLVIIVAVLVIIFARVGRR